MEKIKKLNIITGIILAGFIIAIIYHFILGTIFNLEYPYNTFLFKIPLVDFLYNYKGIFPEPVFNPYIQFHHFVNYFPFGMLTLFFFRLIPFHLSLLIFYSINICFFVFYNYKNIKKDLPSTFRTNIIFSTIVLSFLTYPFLLMMGCGHNDPFIFIFLSLSLYFFSKEKYLKSALILSIPIAMKAFAVILIPLFLVKKKYKEVIYCLLSVFLLTIISLILAKGDIITNISWFLTKHMRYFSQEYIIRDSGLVCSTSLFAIIKIFIYSINGLIKPFFIPILGFLKFPSFIYVANPDVYNIISKALSIYSPFAALSTITIAAYSVFIEKELWKQILLLFICTIIFPPFSADGKLLSLFIPLGLFLNSGIQSKMDKYYAILFGLILIPKNYLQCLVPTGVMHFNISIILNPLILLIMALLIIIEGTYFIKAKERNGENSIS